MVRLSPWPNSWSYGNLGSPLWNWKTILWPLWPSPSYTPAEPEWKCRASYWGPGSMGVMLPNNTHLNPAVTKLGRELQPHCADKKLGLWQFQQLIRGYEARLPDSFPQLLFPWRLNSLPSIGSKYKFLKVLCCTIWVENISIERYLDIFLLFSSCFTVLGHSF